MFPGKKVGTVAPVGIPLNLIRDSYSTQRVILPCRLGKFLQSSNAGLRKRKLIEAQKKKRSHKLLSELVHSQSHQSSSLDSSTFSLTKQDPSTSDSAFQILACIVPFFYTSIY